MGVETPATAKILISRMRSSRGSPTGNHHGRSRFPAECANHEPLLGASFDQLVTSRTCCGRPPLATSISVLRAFAALPCA
jgi:hypothetical protein